MTTPVATAWALGGVAVATVARVLLEPVVGPTFPYLTYYAVVVIAGAMGGFPGAGLAIAGSLICAWWLFLPPRGRFAPLIWRDTLSLIVFTANVSTGAVCAAVLRLAVVRVARTNRRNEVLVRELNHRVNNNLASVLSLARQIARHEDSTRAFLPAFEARVLAMARSHDLLASAEWENVELRRVLESALVSCASYGEGRVSLSGPDLSLPASKAVSLGVVVSELASNAAKHGALAASGSVSVRWSALDGERCRLLWVEQGGPVAPAQMEEGVGARLMQRLLKGDLDGSISFAHANTTFNAELVFRP